MYRRAKPRRPQRVRRPQLPQRLRRPQLRRPQLRAPPAKRVKRNEKSERSETPFGFVVETYLAVLRDPCDISPVSHTLHNRIQGFDQTGTPVFRHPDKVCTIDEQYGMLARIDKADWAKSLFHTEHTISLFYMAFKLLQQLHRGPRARWGLGDGVEKQVNVQQAVCQHRSTSSIWLNCRHRCKSVVLKTTSDPYMKLRYVLDGVIHYLISRHCPEYVPELHFVSLLDNGDVAICSEQLEIPTLYKWVSTILVATRPRTDWNRALWLMMRNVCRALRRLQLRASFTHRDCHASNVYYDMEHQRVVFIDFDWSSTCVAGKVVSEPRFLYDTTRPAYGHNKSLDCCILFRSLLDLVRHNRAAFGPFLDHVLEPLFQRYEQESQSILKRSSDQAAMQLYKMNTENNALTGRFGHRYGIKQFKKEFEYKMGYYEWPCMTPTAILHFLNRATM